MACVSSDQSAGSPVEMYSALYGSSSDRMWLAMVRVWRSWPSFPLPQVHIVKRKDMLSFKSFCGSLQGQ